MTSTPEGLAALLSLGWCCPTKDPNLCGAPPARTEPEAPTPAEVLTCTIVCQRGHRHEGER